MKRSFRIRPDLQDYYNDSYIAHLLDDAVFDVLNETDDRTFLYRHGAMDAPEIIPAGSMVALWNNYDRSVIERGVSLKERQEQDEEIAQIMDGVK